MQPVQIIIGGSHGTGKSSAAFLIQELLQSCGATAEYDGSDNRREAYPPETCRRNLAGKSFQILEVFAPAQLRRNPADG